MLSEFPELELYVESAGTHGYHIGEPPDSRAITIAKKRGYDISHLRARKLDAEDFNRFDLILGLDSGHLNTLKQLHGEGCKAQVALFLDYAGLGNYASVPDPYYGTTRDFEHVLDLIEEGTRKLYQRLQAA